MIVFRYNGELVKTLWIFRNVVCKFFCTGFYLTDFDPLVRRSLIEVIRFGDVDCGGSLVIQTLPFESYGVVFTCRFYACNVCLTDKWNTVLFPERIVWKFKAHVSADRRIDVDNRQAGF